MKVKSLAKRLQINDDSEDVISNRVIQSHTPMKDWTDNVKSSTVLITGWHPQKARLVAE